MDLSLSPSDLTFQTEVRDWIAANFDTDLRARMALSKNGYVDKASQVAWQKKLAAKGWIAPNWPKEYGGPGLSTTERYILQSELSGAGTPSVAPFGVSMVACRRWKVIPFPSGQTSQDSANSPSSFRFLSYRTRPLKT